MRYSKKRQMVINETLITSFARTRDVREIISHLVYLVTYKMKNVQYVRLLNPSHSFAEIHKIDI